MAVEQDSKGELSSESWIHALKVASKVYLARLRVAWDQKLGYIKQNPLAAAASVKSLPDEWLDDVLEDMLDDLITAATVSSLNEATILQLSRHRVGLFLHQGLNPLKVLEIFVRDRYWSLIDACLEFIRENEQFRDHLAPHEEDNETERTLA